MSEWAIQGVIHHWGRCTSFQSLLWDKAACSRLLLSSHFDTDVAKYSFVRCVSPRQMVQLCSLVVQWWHWKLFSMNVCSYTTCYYTISLIHPYLSFIRCIKTSCKKKVTLCWDIPRHSAGPLAPPEYYKFHMENSRTPHIRTITKLKQTHTRPLCRVCICASHSPDVLLRSPTRSSRALNSTRQAEEPWCEHRRCWNKKWGTTQIPT